MNMSPHITGRQAMQPTAAGRAARALSSALVLGVFLAACGGDSTDPPPAVATVEVSPPTADRQVGQTIQLSATVKDASGNILSGQAVAWSSSAANVASVSSSGLVTTSALGTATITAAAGSKSGVAIINVLPEPIASITVAPANDTLLVGETAQLTATLRDAANNIVTRPVTWTSTVPTVASVSNSGLVTGVADGTATISAAAEGRSASATIRVLSRCNTSLAATIAVGQTINASLANTDCKLDDDTYADGYALSVTTVTNAQIDMTASFDTYLFLLELLPTGTLVSRATNDDVDPDDPNIPNDPIDTNSRITFALQPGAQYFILANSFDPNIFGDYQLKVTAVAFVAGSSVVGKPGKAPISSLIKAIKATK
jgi:hypothetical protein